MRSLAIVSFFSSVSQIAKAYMPLKRCRQSLPQRKKAAKITSVSLLVLKKYGNSFTKITPQQRHDLLVQLDKDSNDFQKKVNAENAAISDEQKHEMAMKKDFDGKDPWADKRRADPNYYYAMMKQLSLLGYFTSEIGCTKARRYVETPGRFDPCIPYTKGDKAFA